MTLYILLSTDYYTHYEGWTTKRKVMLEHTEKHWQSALRIRLLKSGIKVEHTSSGTSWESEKEKGQ